jgi:hypothetical protein
MLKTHFEVMACNIFGKAAMHEAELAEHVIFVLQPCGARIIIRAEVPIRMNGTKHSSRATIHICFSFIHHGYFPPQEEPHFHHAYSNGVFIAIALILYVKLIFTAWLFPNLQDLPASINTLPNASLTRIIIYHLTSDYCTYRTRFEWQYI